MGLLVMGQPLLHRTQLVLSVEADLVLVVDVSDEAADLVSDLVDSVFAGVAVLLPESLLSDVIDDEAAPRLSVL
jgi:hypothetical protein